jgi:hypothetical protein
MRRVVTGHRNGKSVILEDAEMPGLNLTSSEFFELWETSGIPDIPVNEKDLKKQLPIKMPGAGEIRLRFCVVPPNEKVQKIFKEKGIDQAEEWRKRWGDELGMHTTDTVDYAIVLSGEMWMKTDDNVEVHLKPFDCVIQNGTRHAWQNKSSENCIMAFIMIGAKRKK